MVPQSDRQQNLQLAQENLPTIRSLSMSTLRTTAFQLASLALFIGSATQAMAEDITFVSQGGAYQEAQSKAILEPAAKSSV
jgi:hypothetical protein